MKFSYQWIQQLVDGLSASPTELGQLITMKTAECDGIEAVGTHFSSAMAARVVSAEPIDGSHNRVAVIDTGGRLRTVVCGAPNCGPGITTAYLPPGTRLGDRTIQTAIIAGIESEGMLASGAELGINRDHAGILELGGEPGDSLGLRGDHLIEIDNKSLTHRPDLWGHYGMAREVAAITRLPLKDPVHTSYLPRAGDSPIRIEIEDLTLCPRYSAVLIENIQINPSPLWLQYRLTALGLNPINNIVDLTNYIMAELGQPIHAFDADRLQGGTIFVRRAHNGERLRALNGEEYTLDPAALVIADASGPVGLAGVIGGADSAIGGNTTRILIESANFQAASIRKTSSRLKLRTDASMRFEKSQDPENTLRALARAIELLHVLSPGFTITGGIADLRRETSPSPVISLQVPWLSRKLGKAVSVDETAQILEALEFGVERRDDTTLDVTVPTWRATKDVSLPDDLVEEVGRMIGYGAITPEPPMVAAAVPHVNEERRFHRWVRQRTAALGYSEAYNYSFISEELAKRFGFPVESHLRVLNPISADQSLLRLSLLPGFSRNLTENAKNFENFRLFEIGREIHPQPDGLPLEVNHLLAAVYDKQDGVPGLFALKQLALSLAPGIQVRHTEPRCYEHPARSAELVWQSEVVGRLYELHPSLLPGRAALLDLNLDRLQTLIPATVRYRAIRRTPASEFDLSVITAKKVFVASIEQELRAHGGEYLEKIEFLTKYSGPPFPEDRQSISFRITLANPQRTISSDEASGIRSEMIRALQEKGFEIRA